MYYVYILFSEKSKVYYVGMTKDVLARLKEHNRGKSNFTKGHLPWTLVYKEGPYETKEARKLEKYYKTSSGKEKLRSEHLLD